LRDWLKSELDGKSDGAEKIFAYLAADQAAKALKDWEKATEYMKVDGIGVLVNDDDGKVKEPKLGKRAGKRGMGIGVALGLVGAIPTAGYSPVGGILGAGGTAIGQFFHKGLKMTGEDAARTAAS
jgi:hypothetical protein